MEVAVLLVALAAWSIDVNAQRVDLKAAASAILGHYVRPFLRTSISGT